MFKNNRILIVDDNHEIHGDFKKILGSRSNEHTQELSQLEEKIFGSEPKKTENFLPSFELDSAFQGQEALEMVEKSHLENRPYALLFVDVRMPPGWDGIETIKQIWKKFPHTEMVICTAYSDYSSEDILKELSVSHRLLILKKPFDSIAVKQMALTLTRKWNLEEESRNQVKNLETAVRERTRELEESLKKLSDAQAILMTTSKMSALGEMAGGIAHEINNPLAIIQMRVGQLAELLQEENWDKKLALELTDKIEKTSMRISKIIRGLRLFSRDKSKDPFEEISMKTVIEDTLDFCREKFTTNGIEFKVDEVNEKLKLDCRSTEIVQVLLNLLNNAFDAVMTESEKKIKLAIEDLGSEIQVSVTDSGSGIPEKSKSKIFEPFYTTKPVDKGTGLGLSVSKGLIENHGGKIRLNENSSLTEFVITLPKQQLKRS